MVGEHQPLVPELDPGQHHLVDGLSRRRSSRSAGGSRRAAPRTSLAAVDERATRLLLQRRQVGGQLARDRLGDDAARRLPDAGDLLEGPGLGALAQLAGVDRLQRLDGVAERLDAVGARTGAFEEEGHPAQRLDGVHRCLERLEQRDHQRPNWRAIRRSQTRSPATVWVAAMTLAAGVSR